jgi:hypothetical protein
MKVRIELVFAFLCILSLVIGCSGAGGGSGAGGSGGNQSGDPDAAETTQTEDSTLNPDQVVAVPQSNGSYQFQVVDYNTSAAISGATVTFKTGGSTASDASGFFTVPGDIMFSVQKDGYGVSTSISSGNLIKKWPLNPAMYGTWICYEASAPVGINPQNVTDINDTVTFNSNGTTTRSGQFGTWSRDYFVTTRSTGIDFCFLYNEGTPADAYRWAQPGSMVGGLVQFPICFNPVKIEGGVLSRQNGGPYTYKYTHDGKPPGAGGSNSFTFGGSNQTIVAAGGSGSYWYIATSSIMLAITNAPSSGTVAVDSSYYVSYNMSAPAVQLSQMSGAMTETNTYIAVSGTMTVNGNKLTMSVTLKTLHDIMYGGGTDVPVVVEINR